MPKSKLKNPAYTSTEIGMNRVTLWVYFDSKWWIHGSFTDPNALVQAVKTLCTNPDVKDFKVTLW